jgi:hypothetical protein
MVVALEDFYGRMKDRPAFQSCNVLRANLLEHKIRSHFQKLDLMHELRLAIQVGQRRANGHFEDAIGKAMADCYAECGAQSGKPRLFWVTFKDIHLADECKGPGMFQKLKDIMGDGIGVARISMLKEGAKIVKKSLNEMVSGVTDTLLKTLLEVIEGIESDYIDLLTGVPASEISEAALSCLRELLSSADASFAAVMGVSSSRSQDTEMAEPKIVAAILSDMASQGNSGSTADPLVGASREHLSLPAGKSSADNPSKKEQDVPVADVPLPSLVPVQDTQARQSIEADGQLTEKGRSELDEESVEVVKKES